MVKCSDTQALFNRKRVTRFVNSEAVARRKLVQLNAAATLDFLRAPPGKLGRCRRLRCCLDGSAAAF